MAAVAKANISLTTNEPFLSLTSCSLSDYQDRSIGWDIPGFIFGVHVSLKGIRSYEKSKERDDVKSTIQPRGHLPTCPTCNQEEDVYLQEDEDEWFW